MAYTPKILIVDDKPDNLFTLENTLSECDVEFVKATSANNALRETLHNCFALAIIDVQMPETDGYELARLLRGDEKTKDLPIIFLSAVYSEDFHVFKGYQLGAVDFLTKPYDPEILKGKVNVFLALDRQRHRLETLVEALKIEIGERKRVEEELNAERTYLEKLNNSLGEAVFTVKMPERTIEFVNSSVEQMFGYSAQECIGQKTTMFYPEEGYDSFGEKLDTAVEHEVDILRTEYELKRKNGQVFPAEIATTFLKEGSEVTKVISIIRDITERKKMEEERLNIQKLESLGVLAGGIAHDFNNLLAVILSNVSLIKYGTDPEEKDYRLLVNTEKATFRARDLTQQLITFARGGQPVLERIPIGESIKTAVDLALTGSNVSCEFSFSEDLPPVDADRGQLNQVISNLIINSDHAMPNGGVVHVSAEKVEVSGNDELPLTDGSYIKLTVEDSGIGIPEGLLPSIFDPYFTTKAKGSGLGLATTYSIIKNHGGHIWVSSKLGEGTTFHIYLPEAKGEVPWLVKEEEAVITGQGRVLVMDDEPIVRELLKAILDKLGYECELTENGEQALELCKEARETEKPFQAAILDLTVKDGMGGKETMGRLLEIDPDIKGVVSSGYSEDAAMSNFKKYGFRGVIAKPYTIQKLSKVLHKAITD